MLKKIGILAIALLAVPAAARAEAANQTANPYNCDYSPSCEVSPGVYGAMASPSTSKFNLSIGGYVKFDYVHNTNAVGPRATNTTIPIGGHNDESIMTARQSRFWLKVAGPTFWGAKTNALIEADFFGAGALSNEFGNLRMRHAYGSLDWTDTQLLFGQFWDIFGPASADVIDFGQGNTTGTPNGPRVAQIRLTQKLNIDKDNGFKFVVGVENPMQDNASTGANASANATPNSYGSMVSVDGQLMFVSKVLGVSPGMMGLMMSPFQIGVFGQTGSQKVAGFHKDLYGYGAYTFIPLLKSRDGKHRTMTLSLEGQVFRAAGLSAQVATAKALDKNNDPARGYGYYTQLKFYPIHDWGITGGYMRRNADDYATYGANFEKHNDSAYINTCYDLNAAVRVASEFQHNTTLLGHVAAGKPSYGQDNIVRFSIYYFF